MLKEVLRTGGVQLFQLGSGLLALVLTARLLGPEGRGSLGAVLAWAGLFAAGGSLSLDSVLLHRAARSHAPGWFAPLLAAMARLWSLLALATLLAALACWWLAGDALFGELPPALLLGAWLLLPLLLWGRYQGALLLALGRLDLRNGGLVASGLTLLAALALAVWWLELGVLGALAAQGLAALVLAAWGLPALRQAARAARGAARPWRDLRALALDGAKVHTTQVGHYLYGSVDVMTLNAVAGPAAVGWYQLALRLVEVGAALPQAVATVFRAGMTGRLPRAAWREQRRPILLTLALTLLAGGCGWLLAPWLVPLLAGAAFQPTVELFRLLLPILLARALETLLVPQIFARGYFLAGSLVALLMAGCSAALFLWLIPAEGLDGAVTAALLAFALLPTAIYLGWAWWFERDLRRSVP
jgi:antigen flippase